MPRQGGQPAKRAPRGQGRGRGRARAGQGRAGQGRAGEGRQRVADEIRPIMEHPERDTVIHASTESASNSPRTASALLNPYTESAL